MNTKFIIIAAVILLLLVGGGALLLKNSASNPQQPVVMMTAVPTKPQTMMGTMKSSLMSLLTSGKSQSCTFSYVPTGTTAQSSGTFYLSGGKMRGDFTVMVPSAPQTTISMIRDSDYTYMWGPSLPSGIKIKNTLTDAQGNTKKYLDMNQQLDYKCDNWSVDPSKFTPPANITFQDMSSVMMSPTGVISGSAMPSGTPNASMCAACNSLTGSQKTTCLQQLHCQ